MCESRPTPTINTSGTASQRVGFRLNNRLIVILPLLLAAAMFTISPFPLSAHSQVTGLVCITASLTATRGPASPPTIGPIAAGSSLTVGVFIVISDPLGSLDIFVPTDTTDLNP